MGASAVGPTTEHSQRLITLLFLPYTDTPRVCRSLERTTKARPAQLRRVAIRKSVPATSPVLNGQSDAAETHGRL
jgi:hypothetical protein